MLHFKPHQQLKARDLNQLSEQALRQALIAPAVNAYNNGHGVVLRNPRRSAPPRRGGGSGMLVGGVPCRVTAGSGSAADGWPVALYANGIHAASTGTGRLFLLEVAATAVLPVGAWVMGWPHATIITGGND